MDQLPVRHAEYLASWLTWEPDKQFEIYTYPEADHSPMSMDGCGPRVNDFLASFLTD